jgi:hypothetical protein
MALEIKLDELRQITSRIFDHMQNDLKIDKVCIDQDYYWEISKEELYYPTKDP